MTQDPDDLDDDALAQDEDRKLWDALEFLHFEGDNIMEQLGMKRGPDGYFAEADSQLIWDLTVKNGILWIQLEADRVEALRAAAGGPSKETA